MTTFCAAAHHFCVTDFIKSKREHGDVQCGNHCYLTVTVTQPWHVFHGRGFIAVQHNSAGFGAEPTSRRPRVLARLAAEGRTIHMRGALNLCSRPCVQQPLRDVGPQIRTLPGPSTSGRRFVQSASNAQS